MRRLVAGSSDLSGEWVGDITNIVEDPDRSQEVAVLVEFAEDVVVRQPEVCLR